MFPPAANPGPGSDAITGASPQVMPPRPETGPGPYPPYPPAYGYGPYPPRVNPYYR